MSKPCKLRKYQTECRLLNVRTEMFTQCRDAAASGDIKRVRMICNPGRVSCHSLMFVIFSRRTIPWKQIL